jgi:hypothetical protein
MRKFAIALVAAITVGTTLPAAAQIGFYAGPGGYQRRGWRARVL